MYLVIAASTFFKLCQMVGNLKPVSAVTSKDVRIGLKLNLRIQCTQRELNKFTGIFIGYKYQARTALSTKLSNCPIGCKVRHEEFLTR